MGGEVLSPRMKMISMMYLVLTALLAMNVSKDILEAFVTINTSIAATTENFNEKNKALYARFLAAQTQDAEKVTPYKDKAWEVKDHANELFAHIDSLKSYLILETEKIPEDQAGRDTMHLHDVSAKDDYNVPTYILI